MAKEEEAPPEANRLEPFPHPRETATVFGHDAAERRFLDAWATGRLHHAWMIRGPQGVGKATFAYRIALAVLVHGDTAPETLDVPESHPVARLVRAQSESRLFILRREWNRKDKRHFKDIRAEDARGMEGKLFRLSAADGGWRVAIIDTADELRMPEAANALLKIVEEPPPRSLLLLLTASPGSVLPTIRSRCRTLDLAPLAPGPLAQAVAQARAAAGMVAGVDTTEAALLAALSGGAPGEALRLGALDGVALWTELAALLGAAPGLPRPRLLALAKRLAGREQAPRHALAVSLTVLLLQRLARAGAGAETAFMPGEDRLVQRLAPDLATARAWAELAAEIDAHGAHARAVNLDPANTILNIWLRIDALAARLGARAS
jgi:DNA polymerase-3 subunit delta'